MFTDELKYLQFLCREKNETLKKKKRNKKQSNAEPGIERTVEIMKYVTRI